jgi:hypothetical protein
MMKEEKRTAELKALIMRELKQHPEWHDRKISRSEAEILRRTTS